jgi:hypothetical protein
VRGGAKRSCTDREVCPCQDCGRSAGRFEADRGTSESCVSFDSRFPDGSDERGIGTAVLGKDGSQWARAPLHNHRAGTRHRDFFQR